MREEPSRKGRINCILPQCFCFAEKVLVPAAVSRLEDEFRFLCRGPVRIVLNEQRTPVGTRGRGTVRGYVRPYRCNARASVTCPWRIPDLPTFSRNHISWSRNARASPRWSWSWNAWLRKLRRQPQQLVSSPHSQRPIIGERLGGEFRIVEVLPAEGVRAVGPRWERPTHHACELAPTAAGLRTWHREVTELTSLLTQKKTGPVTGQSGIGLSFA